LANRFREAINNASSVLIGAHLNPDGDTLGSALALSHYLGDMGIACEVVCHHPPPENLRFLPGIETVKQVAERDSYDLGIVVDLDSPERLGSLSAAFETCKTVAVIDHHVPHMAPGDIRIIDETAPATAVILCRLLTELDADITPAMAMCLLTGIVTDTGSFRFRNTTPEALMWSAKLLECGADINLVSEEVFHRKPLSSLRLLGVLLNKMQIAAHGKLAWAELTLGDFESAGASDEDTEGFVNEMLALRTVRVAALFREPKAGRVRVSLRSMGDFDVAEIAREFNGGGHKNAAGMSFESTLDEIAPAIVDRLKRCWESS
jgi:phosphoesterase RecJ-like protein